MENPSSESIAASLPGRAVRRCAMWTPGRGSEQNHVADQPVLPPDARLCSGNSSFTLQITELCLVVFFFQQYTAKSKQQLQAFSF